MTGCALSQRKAGRADRRRRVQKLSSSVRKTIAPALPNPMTAKVNDVEVDILFVRSGNGVMHSQYA